LTTKNPNLYLRIDKEKEKRTEKLIKLLRSPDFNFTIVEKDIGPNLIEIPVILNIEEAKGDEAVFIFRITSKLLRSQTKKEMVMQIIRDSVKANKEGFILVEGFYRFGKENRQFIQSIHENILSLPELPNLPSVIPTRNYKDSAYCIKSIAKRVQIEDKAPVLSRNKSKMPYLHDAQTFFIEGLLNCGPKKAKLLLKEMDVPDEIIQCILKNPEKIESIKGFGEEFISQNNNMLKKRS